MGCSGSKPNSMIFGGQIDGTGMGESCPLIMELRSRGLADPSPLVVHDSIGRHKLKRMISKNPDFASSIIGFFNHVILMPLRSLTATKLGIEEVRTSLETVRAALLCFEEEEATKKNSRSKQKYMEVVAKLRAEWEVLAVRTPNSQELQSVREQQLMLLEKLSLRKHKLQKSLRRAKMWRKACKAINTMFYIVVCAGSVVLTALAAPPAATIATTMASNNIKLMEPWLNSLCEEQESTMKAEMEVVAAMEKDGFLVHEFMTILSLMEMVDIDLRAMSGKEEEVVHAAATFGIGNIMNKIGVIERTIDGLDGKVDCHISEIRKVAAQFLEVITEENT